jgi:hypothetical protein
MSLEAALNNDATHIFYVFAKPDGRISERTNWQETLLWMSL